MKRIIALSIVLLISSSCQARCYYDEQYCDVFEDEVPGYYPFDYSEGPALFTRERGAATAATLGSLAGFGLLAGLAAAHD